MRCTLLSFQFFSSLRESLYFQVLPRFDSTETSAFSSASRTPISMLLYLSLFFLFLSLSFSVLFILYTITPQFAAKCPSNLLTAQRESTSFIKWLIASIYLRACVVFCRLLSVEPDGAKCIFELFVKDSANKQITIQDG